MSWIPPVRAELVERLIFNFRMPPRAMSRFLPRPWLTPQVANGFAVASFCILDLRGITVAPLPTVFGVNSISCAPRYAVIDSSSAVEKPAVYVTERWTGSAFGSWFTSLGFSCRHPYARSFWQRTKTSSQVVMTSPTLGQVISARVGAFGSDTLQSAVFDSTDDFSALITQGVSSYGPSRYPGRLTRVDLKKAENRYTPLIVEHLDGPVVREWIAAGGILDSVLRTSGGRYEWTYLGLTSPERVVDETGQPETVMGASIS